MPVVFWSITPEATTASFFSVPISFYNGFLSQFEVLQRLEQYPKQPAQAVLVQKAQKSRTKRTFDTSSKKAIQLEKKWPMRPRLTRLNAISLRVRILQGIKF